MFSNDGAPTLELKFLQAIKYHIFARKEVPRVKDLVKRFLRKLGLGVGFQVLAVGRTIDSVLDVGPYLHGVTLNDNVCVFARDAGLNQGKQHLRREDKALGAPQIVFHLGRVSRQASTASCRTCSPAQ